MSGLSMGGDHIKFENDDSSSMLKPREDSLGRLKKENFSLKMRINLLEEFVRSFSEDKVSRNEVDLQKKIIDLEIKLLNLKRDMSAKQKLLAEAANAIDLVEKSYAEKLTEMVKENQLLAEHAAKEALGGSRPKSGSSRIRSEKGMSTLDQGESQSGRSVRKEERKSKGKLTRTLCEQVDAKILRGVNEESEISTSSTSTCGVNKFHPEMTAVQKKDHLQLKKEYEKGCLAIQTLISCVKDISSESLSLKQEANSTKMLYLHESRVRRESDGELSGDDEDERQARRSMKTQEHQFWWSVVSELVTRNISGPFF